MEWKQWEGRVIDEEFHLHRYVGGSAHSGVFLTEFGAVVPQKAVIKLVPADSAQAETWVLRRELAARLSHPGLLSIFHCGACQIDGINLTYAVMEPAEEDLSQVISVRPLEPAEVREMFPAVLETLRYLHAEGFVHGCLTPSNIMAVGDQVKLSSDGLLRIGESSDDLWAPNVNGPPESRAGLTPAGDVWSLGMLVVQALTEQPPAWDRNAAAAPAVPAQLDAPFFEIAQRSLRCDPRSRCSIEDIALTLQPPEATPQPGPAVLAAKRPAPLTKPAPARISWKRLYLWAAAAGILAGGLVVISGSLLTHRRASSPSPAEAPASLPSEPAAIEQQPAAAPAAPAAADAAPPNGGTPEEAPAAEPRPAPSPATADNSAARLPAADVVNSVVPEVPREILSTVRGLVTVRVRVRIDASGSVADAQLASHPSSRYFDRLALDAARRWKFAPAASAASNAARSRVVRFEFRAGASQAFADPVQP